MPKKPDVDGLRKFLLRYSMDNESKFKKEMNSLDGKDFVGAYLSLLEYCTPKLQRAEIEQTTTLDLSLLSDDELRAVSALLDKVG